MDSLYYPFNSLTEARIMRLMLSLVTALIVFPFMNAEIKESIESRKILRTKAQQWVYVYEETGIKYPEVALAQTIQETSWMRADKANDPVYDSEGNLVKKGSNNLFGMKINSRGHGVSSSSYCPEFCHDCIHACYESKEDSMRDYRDWQAERFADYERYHGVPFNGSTEEYIAFLGNYVIYWKDGSYGWYSYAEDPGYLESISSILHNSVEKHLGTL